MNADAILTRYDILVDVKDKPETIAAKVLPRDPVLRKVAEDVVFLRSKNISDDTTEALNTKSAEEVIENGLLKGMDVVAELYGRGIYYLPHVMVAADAMDKGTKLAERSLSGERKLKGTAIMHAAEGDPHDISKNIAAVLLRSNGYGIVDLGRDVAVKTVVKAVEEQRPTVVAGTALMTTTMSAFPRVAERLEEKGIGIPFICAGGAVNRSHVGSYPLGIFAEKAANGPGLVGKAAAGWDWKKIRDYRDAIKAGKV